MFDRIVNTLAADVATNGTFTVPFPTGRTLGSYLGSYDHRMFANQTLYLAPASFTLAFTTLITVTWKGLTTLPAGTVVDLQVDRLGQASEIDKSVGLVVNTNFLSLVLVNLGSPVVGVANDVCASQSLLTAGSPSALLNGTTAGILDVPRTVNAAWTTTAVLTINGKDGYGNTIREVSASGAAHTGKKAFKSITSITTSADITALTVGRPASTAAILGLPVFLPQAAMVLREMQDGVTAAAGTIVAGVSGTQTGTTGDVRGTYTPAAAPNGTIAFALLLAIPDPTYRGGAQFVG